ncbi:MAG: flagellar biosynthesis protein FlhB [Candidatus Hydrogenedentota bacterium]
MKFQPGTPNAAWKDEFWFDLQLFASEDEGRTEDPTGKRISKAHGEGQFARSPEIGQVLGLVVGAIVIMIILPRFVGYQVRHLKYFLGNLSTLELSQESLIIHFYEIMIHFAAVLWPIALAEIIVTTGASLAQTGFHFSWTPLQPKWNKIFPNPSKLIDRLVIGKTMLFNLVKSTAKVAFIGWIAYGVISDYLPQLLTTWSMQPYPIIRLIVEVSFELVKRICFFLAVIAAADYAFNHWQWKDSLKMKKEEVKDESKQSEGDPQVKQAQRKRMMMMARRRMMREIPTADVVITNPTHYSVAVKYDQSMMVAPRVIAKGEGFIALKIRQIAQEHGIPLYENKPLAQALYKGVEIGDEVPPQFYQAIAEVLAYVYRQKKKTA